MKYVCLVYRTEEAMASVADSDCIAYGMELHERGQRLGGEALQPVHTATTVRVRNGQVLVTDGPFAETKEQLGGDGWASCVGRRGGRWEMERRLVGCG